MSEILENEARLAANEYPGRGIIMGVNESGTHAIQMYWLMGRSAGSRNRVFERQDETVRTVPFEEVPGEDHSLTIYNAMREAAGAHVVTNGHQTDTIVDELDKIVVGADKIQQSVAFKAALEQWEYEPDDPNFTPRISGLLAVNHHPDSSALNIWTSIIKRNPENGDVERETTDNLIWLERIKDDDPKVTGTGVCLHTYDGNGDPIPSFSGEPYQVGLENTAEENAKKFAGLLNGTNLVSLVAKAIPLDKPSLAEPEFYIINKNQPETHDGHSS